MNKNIILFFLFYIIFNNIPNNNLPLNNPLLLSIILYLIINIIDSNNHEKFIEPLDQIKINKKIIPVKKNENLSKLVDKTNIKDLDIKYKKSIEDIKKANDLGYKSVDNIVKDSNKNCNCEEVSKKSIYNFLKERRLIDKRGLLHYADDYFADMGYSDIRWENYISPKQGGNGVYNTFDMHKYNILNTDRWAPPSRFHADCKTDNPNIISPVATSGYPVNLLEFDESRKILPRDKINIEYIKDRLNS